MIENRQLFVDLGCGMHRPDSNPIHEWVGIDIRPFKCVDFVLNIGTDTFPFDDDSVDYIRAIHLFEHLYPEELFHCIDECWRVLKPKGELYIEVPKAGTPAYLIHPDHKIQFIEDTFGFFQVPGNENHEDLHGYLKGFWHVGVKKTDFPQEVRVSMFPNKPGDSRFPYQEVKLFQGN